MSHRGVGRREGDDPGGPGCGVPEPRQDALPIPPQPLPTLAAPVIMEPGAWLLAAAGVNPFLNSLLFQLLLLER